MSTVAIPKPKHAPREAHEPGWRVMILNDDVTPIDVVVAGIQKAAGLSQEVAEMIALEAHHHGEAVVKRALAQTDAEAICVRLKQHTRIPRLCPGVGCRAELDE